MVLAIILPEATNEPISHRMLIGLGLVLIVTVATYSGVFYLGHTGEVLFAGFGDSLPQITAIFFASYRFVGAFILIGLIPYWQLFKSRNIVLPDSRRLASYVFASLGIAWAVMSVAVAAMYAPIFQMESLVQ